MTVARFKWQRQWAFLVSGLALVAAIALPAQQMVTETRDPAQSQDEDFAKSVKEWTTQPYFISPLVDHLPRVPGIPMPKDVLGYHVGAPGKLTYYTDALKYYRALAAATPRVKIETIGRSDEDRELVVVWVSSDENIANLQRNRANLAKIADPRGLSEEEIRRLIAGTRPHYHLMGGLHSGETGPSEMLMELVYRLATENSPLIRQIRENVFVSVTPQADPDGRDRNLDWFYRTQEEERERASSEEEPQTGSPAEGRGGRAGGPGVPYWGKYVYHDNNRDINLSQVSMRALADWYFTAHPPIMHDLHESQPRRIRQPAAPTQAKHLAALGRARARKAAGPEDDVLPEPLDSRDADEAARDRALAEEDEPRRPGLPQVTERLAHVRVEPRDSFVLTRRDAEPHRPHRTAGGRDPLDRLRSRAVGGDGHPGEHARQHRGGDREAEHREQRAAAAPGQPPPREPGDVARGSHLAAFRRRYAAAFVRLPQIDIEHQLDDTFREAS